MNNFVYKYLFSFLKTVCVIGDDNIEKLIFKGKEERGSIIAYVLFTLLLMSLLGVYSGRISLSLQVVSFSLESEIKAQNLAEAGVEKVRFKRKFYEFEVGESITESLGKGNYQVVIIDVDPDNKSILKVESTGIYDKAKYTIERVLME